MTVDKGAELGCNKLEDPVANDVPVLLVVVAKVVDIDEGYGDFISGFELSHPPVTQPVAPRERRERIPRLADLLEKGRGGEHSAELFSAEDGGIGRIVLDKGLCCGSDGGLLVESEFERLDDVLDPGEHGHGEGAFKRDQPVEFRALEHGNGIDLVSLHHVDRRRDQVFGVDPRRDEVQLLKRAHLPVKDCDGTKLAIRFGKSTCIACLSCQEYGCFDQNLATISIESPDDGVVAKSDAVGQAWVGKL